MAIAGCALCASRQERRTAADHTVNVHKMDITAAYTPDQLHNRQLTKCSQIPNTNSQPEEQTLWSSLHHKPVLTGVRGAQSECFCPAFGGTLSATL